MKSCQFASIGQKTKLHQHLLAFGFFVSWELVVTLLLPLGQNTLRVLRIKLRPTGSFWPSNSRRVNLRLDKTTLCFILQCASAALQNVQFLVDSLKLMATTHKNNLSNLSFPSLRHLAAHRFSVSVQLMSADKARIIKVLLSQKLSYLTDVSKGNKYLTGLKLLETSWLCKVVMN